MGNLSADDIRFGQRLREFLEKQRKDRGDTPDAYAKSFGDERASVREILRGRTKCPGAINAYRIVTKLGKTIDDFTDEDTIFLDDRGPPSPQNGSLRPCATQIMSGLADIDRRSIRAMREMALNGGEPVAELGMLEAEAGRLREELRQILKMRP